MVLAAVVTLVGAPACKLDVAWSGQFACDAPSLTCPDDYTCEYGQCVVRPPPGVPPGSIDGDAAPLELPDASPVSLDGGADADASAGAIDSGPDAQTDAAPPVSFEVSLGERNDATVRVVTTDTYLARDQTGENFGDADEVEADALPQRTGLLRFDLSSLSPTLRCSQAELVVRFSNDLENGDLQIFALRESWIEDEATWNRRGIGTPWSVAGALEGAHAAWPMGAVAPREVGEYTIPLDPLAVEAWIHDPTSNFGMAWLSTSTSGRGATFESSEAFDPGDRPLLRLQLSP